MNYHTINPAIGRISNVFPAIRCQQSAKIQPATGLFIVETAFDNSIDVD